MNDKEMIEEMAKEIARVLFEIRQDMTSVIRYIRHEVDKEKELYSNFTLGQFIDRHLKYRQLADETSRNILKNLNENHKLKEIENLCVNIARNGMSKDSVVLSREEYEELKGRAEEVFNEMSERMKAEVDIAKRMGVIKGGKETAEKIWQIIKDEDLMFGNNRYRLRLLLKDKYGVDLRE